MSNPAVGIEDGYACESEGQEFDVQAGSWCRYCGADVLDSVKFCFSCGRAGVVDEDTKVPIGAHRAVSRPRQSGTRTALCFARSRCDYSVQRSIRKSMIKVAVALLVAVPYYAGCKSVLGDAFPSNVVAYAQELDQVIANKVATPSSVRQDSAVQPIIVASN